MSDFLNCGVYRWLNTVTGKSYVGSAVNMGKRKARHLWALRSGVHCNPKLQRAWDKYGPEAWEFEPLAFCPEADLIRQEQIALDVFDAVRNGYNIRLIAESNLGIKHSEKSKAKISCGNKGKRLGKKQTIEWIAQRVVANTGQTRSEQNKALMKTLAIARNAGAPLVAGLRAKWSDPAWVAVERERRTKTSLCEPHRDVIEALLPTGRDMREIWRILKSEHGFSGGELSVERFIRRMKNTKAKGVAAAA